MYGGAQSESLITCEKSSIQRTMNLVLLQKAISLTIHNRSRPLNMLMHSDY